MTLETIPSPPPENPEVKLKVVIDALADAIRVLTQSRGSERFGKIARLSLMARKIELELVKSLAQIRAAQPVAALDGVYGAQAQYVAQEGGDVDGLLADYQDHAILNDGGGGLGMDIGNGGMIPYGGVPIRPMPDGVQLQRDLLAMLQGHLDEQKKSNDLRIAARNEPDRLDVYAEMNELLSLRAKLDSNPAPRTSDQKLRDQIQVQIERCVDRIASGEKTHANAPVPAASDVVPTELLRRHPPRAGEQWGDARHDLRPVLHREERDEGTDPGVEADGDHEAALGG